MEIWDILGPFDTFCIHLVHFSGFGIMYQEKSGNPDVRAEMASRNSRGRNLFSAPQ
jgi:hypothetical protein